MAKSTKIRLYMDNKEFGSWKRDVTYAAIIVFLIFLLSFLATEKAASQKREVFKDTSGKVVGTATTQNDGRTVYRDTSGRVTGSSEESGNGREVYRDASGKVEGFLEKRDSTRN